MTVLAALALVALGVVGAAPAGAEAGSDGPTKSAPVAATLPAAGSVVRADGVTRTVLAVDAPANAPGQVLYLTRVRIAPKTPLTEHFHDGTQVASVRSGTLTYRISAGSATITDPGGRPRTVTGPATVRIPAGSSITENVGLVHTVSNRTDTPVVALTAALIARGSGLSTPVGSAVAGAPLAISTTATVTENRLVTLTTPAGVRRVGTAVETADATVAGGPLAGRAVAVTIAFQVAYLDGSGPWSGVLTLGFADGSTIVGTVQGATLAAADGSAAFAATVAVLGGTGGFAGVTGGGGTYTGARAGSLGTTPIETQIDLRVTGL